jgi:hypothetical protein
MPANRAPNPPGGPTKGKRPALDPKSARQRKLRARTHANLGDAEKAFRDKFISEYLYDFNAAAAYLRAGGARGKGNNHYARAHDLMSEPYVVFEIRKTIDAAKESDLINRNRTLAGLVREANFHGVDASHGARVGALKFLAEIQGMNSKAPPAGSGAAAGGILVVPETASVQDWEARSAQAQKELKESVRK